MQFNLTKHFKKTFLIFESTNNTKLKEIYLSPSVGSRYLLSSAALSLFGQQHTLKLTMSLPRTEQHWSSRVKITCVGLLLGPPTSEFKHMNLTKIEKPLDELGCSCLSFMSSPRGTITDNLSVMGSSQYALAT